MKTQALLILSCLAVSCQRPDAEAPQDPAQPADAAEASEPAAPAADAADPNDPETYVGLTAEAAGERADAAGIPHRINEIDGESQPVTLDYRPERLNFAIDNGIVVRVTKG